MKRLYMFAVALAAVAGAINCVYPDNPRFCEGHPEASGCDAGLPDTPPACTTNASCMAPTGVCEVASGMCVQCTANDDAACTGTSPVCGSNNACRPCEAHGECDSNVCLPDGSCADAAQVAYVDAAGTDNATCMRATPCTKLTTGLATDRPYVKLAGAIDEGATVTIDNQDVTLLANPGAKVVRTSNGIVLEVKGTSRIAIYDLEISGGSGAQGIGISLPPGNTATLDLVRATIASNAGGGITASGGTLSISQSMISGNAGGGIMMSSNGVVTLTNNFIHHNGNNLTASAGGLSLRPMTGSKVEFNTIVDNQANLNAASAGGVFCDVTGFVAPNNIIFRNTGGTTGTAQTFGNCTYGNSINTAGTGATDNSLGFVSPNMQPLDYHLGTSSPSSVVDAAGACTGVDFDGDQRPQGAACDLGADERVP